MARELPHHKDAERSVLGTILLDPKQIAAAMDMLLIADFHIGGYAKIYQVMIELANDDEKIDYISVAARLEAKQELTSVGGFDYLVDLSDTIASTVHMETYINIVKDASLKREILKISDIIREDGFSTELAANDYLTKAEELIFAIGQKRRTTDFAVIADIVDEVQRKIEENQNRKGGITGLATGFANLDSVTLGLHPEELIILAARPAMGKSAFAMNLALNIAKRNKEGKAGIAIFSLEMANDQLVSRMISAEGRIPSKNLRSGQLNAEDWTKFAAANQSLSSLNIYFDDSAAVTVSDIRAKCRKISQEGKLDFVVIDYLQLIKGESNRTNRQEEVARISRSLKQMARELKVPVLALSQLSRDVEKRDEKKPVLADLRESGSIEQDADIVMFLYRDDYYNKPADNTNPSTISRTELSIAKNRQGRSGLDLIYYFETEYSKFIAEQENL